MKAAGSLFLTYTAFVVVWTRWMNNPQLRTKTGRSVSLHGKITGQWRTMQTQEMRAHVRRYERVKLIGFLTFTCVLIALLALGRG